MPKLVIVVKGAPAGMEVLRDGTALPAAALGEPCRPIPARTRSARPPPGTRQRPARSALAEGETTTVELTLRPAAAGAASAAKLPTKANDARGGGTPTWAWISGAAGIALAGASVGFLIDDLSAISALRESCREVAGGTYCDPGYDFAADNARKNRDFRPLRRPGRRGARGDGGGGLWDRPVGRRRGAGGRRAPVDRAVRRWRQHLRSF